MRKVYITGTSTVTPWGVGEYRAVCNRDKEVLIQLLPSSLGWKGLDRLPRATRLGCLAMGEALQQAGYSTPISFKNEAAARTGLVVGTSYTNLEAILALGEESKQYGVQYVNPAIFPNTVLNLIAGQASIYFQIQGANITVSNGKESGWKTLLYAHDLVVKGQLDRVIACELRLHKPPVFDASHEGAQEHESIQALVLESTLEKKEGVQLEMKPIASDPDQDSRSIESRSKEKVSLPVLLKKLEQFQQISSLRQERMTVIENHERYAISLQQGLRRGQK